MRFEEVIRVQKLVGLPPPALELLGVFLRFMITFAEVITLRATVKERNVSCLFLSVAQTPGCLFKRSLLNSVARRCPLTPASTNIEFRSRAL